MDQYLLHKIYINTMVLCQSGEWEQWSQCVKSQKWSPLSPYAWQLWCSLQPAEVGSGNAFQREGKKNKTLHRSWNGCIIFMAQSPLLTSLPCMSTAHLSSSAVSAIPLWIFLFPIVVCALSVQCFKRNLKVIDV